MEQNPYSEADSPSASQDIPHVLRNRKFHYRVHKSPPLVPILSQINLVHALQTYFRPLLMSPIYVEGMC